MHNLKRFIFIQFIMLLSCTSGGPLTPSESFQLIKSAVEKNNSDAIKDNLSESSLAKINRLILMIKDMRNDQLAVISIKYGYSEEKLRNLKISDAVDLYFFSEITGVKLSRYFNENIISIDIKGRMASVKTESGIELDFKREGPYWKYDLSDL